MLEEMVVGMVNGGEQRGLKSPGSLSTLAIGSQSLEPQDPM